MRSFRVKKFRIIYKAARGKQISIVALGPRKYLYEETFRIIKRDEFVKSHRERRHSKKLQTCLQQAGARRASLEE